MTTTRTIQASATLCDALAAEGGEPALRTADSR